MTESIYIVVANGRRGNPRIKKVSRRKPTVIGYAECFRLEIELPATAANTPTIKVTLPAKVNLPTITAGNA